MPRKALAVITVGLIVAATAGCTTDAGTVTTRSTDEQTAEAAPTGDAEPSDDAPAGDNPPADEADSPPALATFTDAVSYEDGLKVEVAAIEQSTAGEWAFGADQGDPMTIFDVRITNGGTEPFDAVLVLTSLTYGEAGQQAEEVFDGDLGGGFSGVIPAGQSQTARFAYGIPSDQLDSVTLQVDLNTFEHDPAIFSGAAQ